MVELDDETQGELERAAEAILSSGHLVALAGAGLSVESGIPPFRGPGGLWTKYGEPPMTGYQEFLRDPQLWWESRLRDEEEPDNPVHELKLALEEAAPNAGHYSLVDLEQMGLLKCTVTQNVDNLHRRAGSEALLEIHGNRSWLRCMACGSRRTREGFILGDLPPRCPDCGGMVKMDTVMFGEPIPQQVLQDCWEQAELCDCMLLIGTSGLVTPAARLPVVAQERGATLIEVNPHQTALTSTCDITLAGPSGELLPVLVDLIRQGQEAG